MKRKRPPFLILFLISLAQIGFSQTSGGNQPNIHFTLEDSIILSVGNESLVEPLLSIEGDRIYLMDDATHKIHHFSFSGERIAAIPFELNPARGIIIGFKATTNRFLLFHYWHSMIELDASGKTIKEHKLKLGKNRIGTSVLLFFDPVIMDSVLYFPSSNDIPPNPKEPEKYWEAVKEESPLAAQKMSIKKGDLAFSTLPPIGHWPEPYLTHHTLGHLLDLQFCAVPHRHRLYYNYLADSTIHWVDRNTGETGTLGVRGKYLDPKHPFPLSITIEDWIKRARRFDESQKYLQLFYDAERDWLYRFYAGANPASYAYDGTPDKLYLQVYDLATHQIIADVPFPYGKKIVHIADGQLWIDKRINPRGDYMIYKVGIGE